MSCVSTRNDTSKKTVKGKKGSLPITIPRDPDGSFEGLYHTEVSPALISTVTDEIADEVRQWPGRPPDAIYPILYLDCIHVNVRDSGTVGTKAVYLALGVTMSGVKDLLGMWISPNEGAKFWLSVVTELRNRGVQDIFIACVDGLKGFPQAIKAYFLKRKPRYALCIWSGTA